MKAVSAVTEALADGSGDARTAIATRQAAARAQAKVRAPLAAPVPQPTAEVATTGATRTSKYFELIPDSVPIQMLAADAGPYIGGDATRAENFRLGLDPSAAPESGALDC